MHASQFSSLFWSTLSFFLKYPTYPALGYAANFGFVAFIVLLMQIITGFFLSFHYVAFSEVSFNLLEHIMRDVNNGWLLRYLHANGASLFFFVIFAHMCRGLYYQSYLGYRRDTWIVGVILFFLLIVTAFTGYVLPWGQMSFWAATVVTNLFTAVPLAGRVLVEWLWGGFSVNGFTLIRIFSLHFILPFVILLLSLLHVYFLHYYGGGNRLELHIIIDKLRFAPYYLVKDLHFCSWVFVFFFIVVGFFPNTLLHPDNYIQADPLLTPPHIVPEWYFLIFYAMLRSIPSKIGGVVVLFISIFILFLMPFLSIRKLKPSFAAVLESIFSLPIYLWEPELILGIDVPRPYEKYSFWWWRYYNIDVNLILFIFSENWKKFVFWIFFFTCILLGFIGSQPVETPFVSCGRFFTLLYFIYFIILFSIVFFERLKAYKFFWPLWQVIKNTSLNLLCLKDTVSRIKMKTIIQSVGPENEENSPYGWVEESFKCEQ